MLTDDELDQLDRLLLSHTDDDGILLSEFDGLCAGLVVCPEVIMPGEWLPCVWGTSTAPLETLQRVQAVTDLVVRYYNDVARSLITPAVDNGPLYNEDKRTGDIL